MVLGHWAMEQLISKFKSTYYLGELSTDLKKSTAAGNYALSRAYDTGTIIFYLETTPSNQIDAS